MKKIFLPLLALVGMVTGFTLSSCGGGGGGEEGVHNFANKRIRFYGDSMIGSMLVEIGDKRNDGSYRYSAFISFGENGTPYVGYFEAIDNSASPTVTMQAQGDDAFNTDEGVRQFFASFLPADFNVEDSLYGFPQPIIQMTYTTEKSGTYMATYTLPGDDPTTEDVVEQYWEYKTPRPLNFEYENN